MKLLVPKQHGAWAMLIVPFGLGMAASQPVFSHIPLFLGWLLIYLSSYPLLMVLKKKQVPYHLKWFYLYFLAALVVLAVPILMYPKLILIGMSAVPFFFINVYYAKKNNERSLLNDLAAISILSMGAVAGYYIGAETIDIKALLPWTFSVLFFVGSTFFVKTLIREKRNPAFRWISWGYHFALILLFLFIEPLFAIAYVPSAIRAVWLYGKQLKPMQIGVAEIVNSAFFLSVMYVLINGA